MRAAAAVGREHHQHAGGVEAVVLRLAQVQARATSQPAASAATNSAPLQPPASSAAANAAGNNDEPMWGPGAIASQKSSARHIVPLKRAAAAAGNRSPNTSVPACGAPPRSRSSARSAPRHPRRRRPAPCRSPPSACGAARAARPATRRAPAACRRIRPTGFRRSWRSRQRAKSLRARNTTRHAAKAAPSIDDRRLRADHGMRVTPADVATWLPSPHRTLPLGSGTLIGDTSTLAKPWRGVMPICCAVAGDRSTMRPCT